VRIKLPLVLQLLEEGRIIEDPEGRPYHRLAGDLICETDAWSEISAIRRLQRPSEFQPPWLRAGQRICSGPEEFRGIASRLRIAHREHISDLVVVSVRRLVIFIAQPEIHSQF